MVHRTEPLTDDRRFWIRTTHLKTKAVGNRIEWTAQSIFLYWHVSVNCQEPEPLAWGLRPGQRFLKTCTERTMPSIILEIFKWETKYWEYCSSISEINFLFPIFSTKFSSRSCLRMSCILYFQLTVGLMKKVAIVTNRCKCSQKD